MSVAAIATARRPEVDRLYAAMASPRVRDGAQREHDESMRAQVCVVGSGAGGATLACELARLGHSVILVEEGAYRGGRELTGEADGTRELLLRAPLHASGPIAIPIPTARCVGGTTVVGAGTSHRVPHAVLAAWERDHGLGALDERELALLYARIEAELGVAPVADAGFGRNAALLERGARELGFAGGRVRRAAPGCLATGVCELGCPQDAKLGMHVSHVPRALEAGAILYTRTRAERLLLSKGRVFGVQAALPRPAWRADGTRTARRRGPGRGRVRRARDAGTARAQRRSGCRGSARTQSPRAAGGARGGVVRRGGARLRRGPAGVRGGAVPRRGHRARGALRAPGGDGAHAARGRPVAQGDHGALRAPRRRRGAHRRRHRRQRARPARRLAGRRLPAGRRRPPPPAARDRARGGAPVRGGCGGGPSAAPPAPGAAHPRRGARAA